MGIRHLNRYIQRKCSSAIREISLADLNGKKVAVDASIYMYRFESEEYLISGMYQMAMIMRKCNITPVFVFDGKPPQSKMSLLKQRQAEKRKAESELAVIKQRVDENKSKYAELVECKRKCVRLRKYDIENVKRVLTLCGVTCYQAKGEADELCAKLVIKKRAWACMSEDTDMFVYGCPRVLRYFNLFRGSCLLYETDAILRSLNLTMKEFREICVVSGTDYNVVNSEKFNLYDAIKSFETFKSQHETKHACEVTRRNNKRNGDKPILNFYDWLENNEEYKSDACELYNTDLQFDTRLMSLAEYDAEPILNKTVDREGLQTFLWRFNFVFV